jgi:hypothetical protein
MKLAARQGLSNSAYVKAPPQRGEECPYFSAPAGHSGGSCLGQCGREKLAGHKDLE